MWVMWLLQPHTGQDQWAFLCMSVFRLVTTNTGLGMRLGGGLPHTWNRIKKINFSMVDNVGVAQNNNLAWSAYKMPLPHAPCRAHYLPSQWAEFLLVATATKHVTKYVDHRALNSRQTSLACKEISGCGHSCPKMWGTLWDTLSLITLNCGHYTKVKCYSRHTWNSYSVHEAGKLWISVWTQFQMPMMAEAKEPS